MRRVTGTNAREDIASFTGRAPWPIPIPLPKQIRSVYTLLSALLSVSKRNSYQSGVDGGDAC